MVVMWSGIQNAEAMCIVCIFHRTNLRIKDPCMLSGKVDLDKSYFFTFLLHLVCMDFNGNLWFYDLWFACFLSTESDFGYMRFADQFHRPWPPQPRWDQTAQPDIVVGQRQFESHRLRESTPNSPASHEPHPLMQNDIRSKWTLFDCLLLYILNLQSQAAFSAGSGCKLTSFGAWPIPLRRCPKGLVRLSIPHHHHMTRQVWTRKMLEQSYTMLKCPNQPQTQQVRGIPSMCAYKFFELASLWHIVKIHSNKMHPQLCKLSLSSRKSKSSTAPRRLK